MTWQDRIQPSIVMTSPRGSVFDAKWIGNERTIEKRLGVFNFPNVSGTAAQDLGVTGTQYPLTIYFDGQDNDLIATLFMEACKETGLWEIVHPTKGTLNLQLVSVSESIESVKSGNMTKFVTEWLETIAGEVSVSTAQLAAQIATQSAQVSSVSSEQFSANAVQDTVSQKSAIERAVNSAVGIITSNLKSIYETVPEINSQITSIVTGIQDTIGQATIDTLALAGQIETLVTFPVVATTDVLERLSTYGKLILDAIGLSPSGTSVEDKNTVSVQELVLTSAIVALAQSASTGSLQTRSQAVESAVGIIEQLDAITNTLDATQQNFIVKDIDAQYFSQSVSYSDALTITSQAVGFLLLSAFELAIEKIITLQTPKAPIIVTIEEYGSLGIDDVNLNLFLESNNLKGNENLILQAGRQVVVYV